MRIREAVLKLKPYEWEPSKRDIAEEVGIPEEQILRFDMNTVPIKPEPVLQKFSEIVSKLPVNEYPDPSYRELREALSEYLDVPIENLTVTVGADEALDIMVKTFIDPGTKALISSPTYSFYRVIVETLGGRMVEVLRKPDFSDNIEALIDECLSPDARIVFLCSPNNPTGNITPEKDAVRLLEAVECAVAVDEAYAEFSGTTLSKLTSEFENLIVVRTFSKAFGMAGVRIGYMVAHPKTIELLNKVRPPNSVSVVSLAIAKLALQFRDEILPEVQKIMAEKERVRAELAKLPGLKVYPSWANFVLVRFEEADAFRVYRELLKRGLVVRRLTGPMLEGCLRITILERWANDRLITALREILGETG